MQSSVWVERYRPTNIDEYIASTKIKEFIANIYNTKNVPNMTLYSPKAGSGKTSLAKMIAKDFCSDDEILFINGSLNRNIDTIRNEMTDFVYRPTLDNNKKIIIIDEADGINRIAQDSLRGFIEQWQDECSFILTCNDITRIIPAIISRCPEVNLSANADNRKDIAKQIYDRCTHILRDNMIEFEPEAIKNIIRSNFPDIRQIINILQRLSMSGKLTEENTKINIVEDRSMIELETAITDKNWIVIRNWCHNNYNLPNIYNVIYDYLIMRVDLDYLSTFIIITGEYSYRASLTNYSEINLTSYIAEIIEKVKVNG